MRLLVFQLIALVIISRYFWWGPAETVGEDPRRIILVVAFSLAVAIAVEFLLGAVIGVLRILLV